MPVMTCYQDDDFKLRTYTHSLMGINTQIQLKSHKLGCHSSKRLDQLSS